jgi:hypothetical protein
MRAVKRQALESGILYNATELRELLTQRSVDAIPALHPSSDVEVLERPDEVMETYTSLFDPEDPDRLMLLSHSNRVAAEFNQGVRQQIHYEPEPLADGDRVMAVKNYYFQQDQKLRFIANGESGVVRQVYPNTHTYLGGMEWMEAEIEFGEDERVGRVVLDAPVPLDLLYSKSAALTRAQKDAVYQERVQQLHHSGEMPTRQTLRSDPYINPLQLKMGYAITGHKAQGGQWDHVIVAFEPYLFQQKDEQDQDYLLQALRWTYTAITRASKKLYLFNYPRIKD